MIQLNFLVFSLALLVGLSCIAATILGWVAVSQIRNSNGRLLGMGLAVFDGLLFPLLALDALIGWWILLLIDGLARYQHPEGAAANPMGVLIITIPVVIVADWLIIRRVWRAVNEPFGEGGSPVQSPPKASISLKPVLFTFTGHAVALILLGLLFVSGVPSFVRVFADMDASLPGATLFTIHVSEFLKNYALLLFPAVLVMDFGMCLLAHYLGRRWGLMTWSVLFAVGLLAVAGSTAFSLRLPLRGTTDTSESLVNRPDRLR